MSIFKKYLDNINIDADIDNELRKIVSKADRLKKRRKIKSYMIGALAAGMMTTTVAVGASYNWSISEIMEAWFGENTQTLVENISIVTAENVENNFEHLNINPNGAIVDDNMIIIFLDVERTDGNSFNCKSYTVTDTNGNIYYDNNDTTLEEIPFYDFSISDAAAMISALDGDYKYSYETKIPVRQYLVSDENPEDNKITLAFCFDKTVITNNAENDIEHYAEINSVKLDFRDLEGRKVNIVKKGNAECYDKAVFEKSEGSWYGELKLDTQHGKQITIEPNQMAKFNIEHEKSYGTLEKAEYNFNVKKISISQMSVSLELEGEQPKISSSLYPYCIGEIIMKNGETIMICPDSRIPVIKREGGNDSSIYRSDKWEINMSIMLEKPIDPNDISQVRIGNRLFEISP